MEVGGMEPGLALTLQINNRTLLVRHMASWRSVDDLLAKPLYDLLR